ncbi:hypothetical protein Adt_32812 [Abeliophyllum distichum]|uniref:Uncharacterized protein n=1 Tax=Abeliophyllum distichum TaxID=126358 RepID=A0ABD1QX69_9LAMI
MGDPCTHSIHRPPPKPPELGYTQPLLSPLPASRHPKLTPFQEKTNQTAEALVSISATAAPPFCCASTGLLPRDSPSLSEYFGPSIGAQGLAPVNLQPGKTRGSLPSSTACTPTHCVTTGLPPIREPPLGDLLAPPNVTLGMVVADCPIPARMVAPRLAHALEPDAAPTASGLQVTAGTSTDPGPSGSDPSLFLQEA